jgi:uncharacterized protein (UPF0332 family)
VTAEPDPLERSRQELAAADLLAEAGFAAQAVSRAYFAAFYAAETALLTHGEVRSKHSGVVAAFATVLVREHGFEERYGRRLRSLFERRSQADYGPGPVSQQDARDALEDAALVVAAVQEWLRGRAPT